MKTCPKCEKEKSDADFYAHKNRVSAKGWCKQCFNKYTQDRWRAVKLKAVLLLGGKCCKCGYCKNLSALDFHHLDPDNKEENISKLTKKKWATIVEELKKCILVCRNCHAEIHNTHMNMDDINGIHSFKVDRETKIEPLKYSTGLCTCGEPVYGTKYCSIRCMGLNCRKVERPSKEQLEKDIEFLPMTKIGVKYGVSDNAVRKWLRSYGI